MLTQQLAKVRAMLLPTSQALLDPSNKTRLCEESLFAYLAHVWLVCTLENSHETPRETPQETARETPREYFHEYFLGSGHANCCAAPDGVEHQTTSADEYTSSSIKSPQDRTHNKRQEQNSFCVRTLVKTVCDRASEHANSLIKQTNHHLQVKVRIQKYITTRYIV